MNTQLTKEEKDKINAYLSQKGLPTDVGVTFGDVTMNENYSDVRSRSDIYDFSTYLTSGIKLNIPMLSANMESVTGAELAVAVEREGGMGCVPQTIPIEERLEMISRIKRADAAFTDSPLSIAKGRTLREAKELMGNYGIYSLIIVDKAGRPVGVLAARDWIYETNDSLKVEAVGTVKNIITARVDVTTAEAKKILRKNKIEKLPLVDSKGRLAGLLTSHGLFYEMKYPRAVRSAKGEFLVCGSIGVGREFSKRHLDEVTRQVAAGINCLVIDTARAFSVNCAEAMKAIKKRFPDLPLVVGNVSTPEGVKFLFENGADAVKVNQGRGHVCRTSEIGIGTPQLTAIAKARVIADMYGGKIVADGGMKSDGDMIKAIAAGADTLMSGFFFIGTRESAAQAYYNKQGLPVKNYEGSASLQSQWKRMAKRNLDRARRPEGVTEEVHVTGTVHDKVTELVDAFKSAMSYMGFRTLDELRKNAKFSRQTQAGLFEGTKK